MLGQLMNAKCNEIKSDLHTTLARPLIVVLLQVEYTFNVCLLKISISRSPVVVVVRIKQTASAGITPDTKTRRDEQANEL